MRIQDNATKLGLTLLLLLGWAAPAAANPSLRVQVDQRGDFLLIGNTLAHECGTLGTPAVPAPVVATIGDCPEINPTAADVYFRADDPSAGMVRADSSITPEQARSTAVLSLPPDAEVTHARLYWGSYADSADPSRHARLSRPSAGLDASIMADSALAVVETGNTDRYWYQASADVTDIVRAQGSGPYRVSEVSSLPLSSLVDPYAYVAWYLVVFYARDSEPQRNLALFDGLDLVEPGAPASVTLAGFLVPSSGFDAKLGIVTFEGDATITGDGIDFDGTPLQDAQNPVDNFFNSTRSALGAPVSVAGDLPQLTGTPRSMSGIDLDVLDLTGLVSPGQTSATLNATTTLDTYLLTTFVTSISTLKPNFQNSQKAVEDLNGNTTRPGDELRYTIDVVNHGSDESVQTTLRDPLPMGVSFVPGSLELVSDGSSTPLTDAAGDDAAEYDAATRAVTARLGSGASSSAGGSLAIDAMVSLRFRVTIDADARGLISNQATVHAAGKKGAPAEDTPTDGDASQPGAQTTDVTVNVCDVDADCKPPTPLCDISSDPQTCVQCVTSADCTSPDAPDCSTSKHVCECADGPGKCQKDSDDDGISDDGERHIGTDPNDADTDDDGTPDGSEFAPELDSDNDGVDNAHDADSDNDGLFDGTEQGFGCDNPATDTTLGRCRPDADAGKTKSNPVKADTDRGGVRDGSEDWNLNGKLDADESDPTQGHGSDDKPHDSDHDGLSDDLETFLRSDPLDADSDDDGVPDGREANPSEDTDLDRLVNVLDVDSDNDALADGTELGLDCSADGTDLSKHHCRADADSGMSVTSPLLRDTDRGGVRDGSEDFNADGRVDKGETDPSRDHAADDTSVVDSDGDDLSDGLETAVGSDPRDVDSDDDGVHDGEEPNPRDDHDGDGEPNLLDADSDGDGLFDGTELGLGCFAPETDPSKQTCIADADEGKTETGLLLPDTDFGGVLDGIEDVDHNGRVDPAELDPNDPSDDVIGKPCTVDSDCGKSDSGLVCDAMHCTFGCRGRGGNGCPASLFCSSVDEQVGMCGPQPPEMPDAGPMDSGPPPRLDSGIGPGGKLQGGGCNCRIVSPTRPASPGAWFVIGLALCAWWRRRARR